MAAVPTSASVRVKPGLGARDSGLGTADFASRKFFLFVVRRNSSDFASTRGDKSLSGRMFVRGGGAIWRGFRPGGRTKLFAGGTIPPHAQPNPSVLLRRMAPAVAWQWARIAIATGGTSGSHWLKADDHDAKDRARNSCGRDKGSTTGGQLQQLFLATLTLPASGREPKENVEARRGEGTGREERVHKGEGSGREQFGYSGSLPLAPQ
jgi:hypothetical protein